ncbi:hypothetical protein [uncultured Jatrophihabitans sp.]|uniref:hypothetical protein n=1 Tax=uncultured Jatrophihabitans sp. TaxID=1610747 RepID=UPI0035CBFA8E
MGVVLPALHRAADEPFRLDHFVEQPHIVALYRSGFVDLDHLTGAVDELVPLWPSGHLRTVADERPNRWGDDTERHLVRSPWPSLSVDDVLDLLWRWVERDQDGLVDRVRAARITEVFGWTEERARTVLDGPDPRDDR